MNKHFLRLFLAILIAVTAFTAYAGITFRGSSATVGSISYAFDYSGAGKGDSVQLTATISGSGLTADCINPQGKTAPGQSQFDVNISVSNIYKADRNGRVSGEYTIDIQPSWEEAGCPNKKWSVSEVTGVVTLTLFAQNLDRGDSDTASYVCTLPNGGDCAQQ